MREGYPFVAAKCRACSHVWITAYLPLDAKAFARLAKRAACPKCADTRPLVACGADIRAAGLDAERAADKGA